MKIFKFTLSNIIYFIVVCISFIPLYNRYLTKSRDDRFDFNISTLMIEYALVFLLLFIFMKSKNKHYYNLFSKYSNTLTASIFVYLLVTIYSSLLSLDTSRSLVLFGFGSIGPFLLYLIISYKLDISDSILKKLIFGFFVSNILYLFISYLFAFRYGFTTDFLETRANKNIYGSNAVIGTLCFILPFIFVKFQKVRFLFNSERILHFFRVLVVLWVIISISRWGYATTIFCLSLVIIFINKSMPIRIVSSIVLVACVFVFFVPEVVELLIFRFTGSYSLDTNAVSSISDVTSEEGRIVRWENAFNNVIGKNPFFGIGLGNNYLIDPFGNSDAHNLFVNLLVEQGGLAFLCLIFVFISLFRLVKFIIKMSNETNYNSIIFLFSLGIITFHFWSLTGGTYIQASGIISAVKNYYFFFSLGIIIYVSKVISLKIIEINS